MATAKKVVKKKTSVKKKSSAVPGLPVKKVDKAKAKALGNNKLHVVLGDPLMKKYEGQCEAIKMSKSEVGRLLIDAFANGVIKITVPKVSQTKAIKK